MTEELARRLRVLDHKLTACLERLDALAVAVAGLSTGPDADVVKALTQQLKASDDSLKAALDAAGSPGGIPPSASSK